MEPLHLFQAEMDGDGLGFSSAAQEHRYRDHPSCSTRLQQLPEGRKGRGVSLEGAGYSLGRGCEQGLGFSMGEGDEVGLPLDNRKTFNWVQLELCRVKCFTRNRDCKHSEASAGRVKKGTPMARL